MNKKLSLNQMKDLSIDEIIDLYKHGYRLEANKKTNDLLNEDIQKNDDDDIQKNIISKVGNKAENITEDIKKLTEDTKTIDIPSIKAALNRIVDPFVNFGKAIVSTGYDSSATTIILVIGNGSRLPNPSTDGEFNLVWWNSTDYSDPSDDPNKEIVRCTERSGDILTITRAQEDTSGSDKNLLGKTYTIVLPITAKTVTDLQTDAQSRVDNHSIQTSAIHGVAGNIVGTSDVQVLSNKFIIDPTNSVMANLLKTSTGNVDISSSDTPSIGQVLAATSPTSATWQTLAAPSCFFVAILGSPSSGVFPLAVNFNSTIIGGIGPYTYYWTFGDGGMSTSPNPVHNYTSNGAFTAGLTVIDSLENSATSVTTITVLTGIGLVANGLGISESLITADLMLRFYNASANQASPFQESVITTEALTGIYNLSAGQASPFVDTVDILDTLVGIVNVSANFGSPFSESFALAPVESLAFVSSISIPSSASMTRNSTITLTATCYLYGTPTSCPGLNWSSSNTNIATVSQTGVITSSATNTGLTNITAYAAGVVSNTCVVTVTT